MEAGMEDLAYHNLTDQEIEELNAQLAAQIEKGFHLILLIGVPVMCTMGIIGSTMGLILLRTTNQLRNLVSCDYLSALAICSIVFLLCSLLFWLDRCVNLGIYKYNVYVCKSLTTAARAGEFSIAWLVVLIAFDRALVIQQPLLWKRYFVGIDLAMRRRLMLYVITGLVLMAALFNLPDWFMMAIEQKPDKTGYECTISHEIPIWIPILITRVQCIMSMAIPVLVASVLTGLAVAGYKHCVELATKVRFNAIVDVIAFDYEPRVSNPTSQTHVLSSTNNQNCLNNQIHRDEVDVALDDLGVENTLLDQNTSFCDKCPPNPHLASTKSSDTVNSLNCSSAKKNALKANEKQVTKTLLMLTSMFLFMHLPYSGLRFYRTFHRSASIESTILFVFFEYGAFLLYYFYHASLFYFYIFWSPKMRRRLWPTALQLLECYCMKPHATHV